MTPGARGHTVRASAHAPDGVAQRSAPQNVAPPAVPPVAAPPDVGPSVAARRTASVGGTTGGDRLRPAVVRQFELTEKVHAYDPKANTALIDAAYVLAMKAHGAQKRDNGDPYITHPLAVADVLAGYRLDTASIVTGLLHDVIEDTPVKLAEITERFGKEIAGLVDGVTKLTRLELQSDRTKQAENFRKLVLAMSRDIRVLLVKLADRLHNMRTLHFVVDKDRRKRIARETMEIYAPLAERIGMDAMKTELQTLAFAQLDPEAYDTIHARLNFLRGQGADVIEEVRDELKRICEQAGVHVIEVTGREKSPYSIWEKMQRRNVAFEQLSDIMAFRVVVPNKEACYAALGVIHSAYQVISGRFKDYISTPKLNGYQSLHTGVTLREPRNQKIEVQIRTQEMHDLAENGVATHWVYKAPDAKADGNEVHQYRWVQDLLEILENASAPDDFLEYTKLELYEDRVLLHPQGRADPVAAWRNAGRFRLRGAQPGRRRLCRGQDQRQADAVALPVAARRSGRDHDLARRHAVAAMGTLRRHRQGARADPPLRAFAATRAASGYRPLGVDQGVPPGGCRRLGQNTGAGAEGAEVRQRRGSGHRRRQRQYQRARRGERCLSGATSDTARAAPGPCAAAAPGQAAGQG